MNVIELVPGCVSDSLVTKTGDSFSLLLTKLNENGYQTVLVVDENGRMVGIVTDGDIRRGLLKFKATHELSAQQVMQTNPKVLKLGYSFKDALHFAQRNFLRTIPVVNDSMVPVQLLDFDSARRLNKSCVPVLLMAGGLGNRMKALSDNCPKPMLKVGEDPLLERLLDWFISQGHTEFYISVRYLKNVIQAYFGDGSAKGINITYLEEDSPLGTAGSIGMLPAHLDQPLVVCNGDLLFEPDVRALLKHYNEQNADLVVASVKESFSVPFGVLRHDSGKVLELTEKPTYDLWISGGIYVLSPSVYKGIAAIPKNMPDVITDCVEKGLNVRTFPLYESWFDIGTPEALEKANEMRLKSL